MDDALLEQGIAMAYDVGPTIMLGGAGGACSSRESILKTEIGKIIPLGFQVFRCLDSGKKKYKRETMQLLWFGGSSTRNLLFKRERERESVRE